MYLQTLTVMVSELRVRTAVVRLIQKTRAISHQKKLIDSVKTIEMYENDPFLFSKKYLFTFLHILQMPSRMSQWFVL